MNTFRAYVHLTVITALALLSGCAAKDEQTAAQEELDRILSQGIQQFAWYVHDSTPSAAVTVDGFFRSILERDRELRQLGFEIEQSEVQIDQSESVVLPRIDLVAGANGVWHRDDGWDSNPEVGLLVRYDFNGALFQQDYSAVAAAEKKIDVLRRNLRMKDVLKDAHLLLADYIYKNRTARCLRQLLAIVNKQELWQEQLETVLPGSSSLDREQLLDEKAQVRRELSYLESEISGTLLSLHNKTGGIADIATIGALYENELQVLTEEAYKQSQDTPLPVLLQNSLRANKLDALFGAQLFSARMKKLKAEREKLPRLQGSLGGGSLFDESSEGTSDLLVKLELLYPLFDGGDIDRTIRTREIALQKTAIDVQSRLEEQGFKLQESRTQLQAAGQRVAMAREEEHRHQRKLNALRPDSTDHSPGGNTEMQLQKKILSSRILVVKQELERARAAIGFIYFSGMQFPSMATATGN